MNKGEESRGANEVQAREVRGKDTLANKLGKKSFPCAYFEKKCIDNNEREGHIKSEHKDQYIYILENKLKESEAQLSKLVEDIEKVKCENKELKSIKIVNSPFAKESPGDKYDKEDENKLDSEKELLKGKYKGLKRVGPQVQSEQLFTCRVCGFKPKDQANMDSHMTKT